MRQPTAATTQCASGGSANVPSEPLHHRAVAGDIGGAHAEGAEDTVQDVRLPEPRDERHGRQRDAEEERPGGDDDARAPAVGQPAGGKPDDAVAEGVEREHAGEAGATPPELVEQRREEDAEAVLRAVGGEEDDEGGGDDSPAVKDHFRPFFGTPFLGRISARNFPVYEPAVCAMTSGGPSATISPPSSPPSGPRSTTQSAARITSRWCSTRTIVLPASTSRWRTTSSFLTSSRCRPVVGSSST